MLGINSIFVLNTLQNITGQERRLLLKLIDVIEDYKISEKNYKALCTDRTTGRTN